MKRVLLLSSGKALLPEIAVYKKYITEYELVDSRELKCIDINDFDLIWKFMGTDFTKSSIPLIHEYASLSTGCFAKSKNLVKKYFNCIPELRIFLNETIKKEFNFKDNRPFIYRDMGVDEAFFLTRKNKNYDFVYLGSMSRDRKIEKILKKFATDLKENSLLMIGQPDNELYEKYKKYSNIIFTGKVSYNEVPELAAQAIYGINYIPNTYPYNLQTSTKLLEYVALGLKVVTTDYPWVSEFENKRCMRFLKVSEDLFELKRSTFEQYRFQNSNIDDLKWESLIRKSQIKKHLCKILG